MKMLRLTAFLAFMLCAAMSPGPARADGPAAITYTQDVILIEKAGGDMQKFIVELALTPPQQMNGLMHRTSMPETAGMLFVWPEESQKGFWMKNTLIPLDMLFIRKDGKISHIHENAVPNDLTAVPSNGPVMAVLELNGGASRKFGIAEGDTVHHSFFGNQLAP